MSSSERSDPTSEWDSLREQVIGLGDRSFRKSYYPELQERLRQLERFRALLDESRDAIFMMEIPSGRLVDCSDSACGWTGLARGDLLGRPLSEFLAPEGWAQVNDRFEAVGEAEIPEFETRLISTDGVEMPIEMTVGVRRFEDGLYGVAVARDIAARRLMQESLHRSQKMESIGRLAGGIAHDFNNVLGAILGTSELALLKLREQDPLRSDMNTIVDAANRAADLTRQLLAFGRKQVLSLRVLDLNEVIGGLLPMLRRVIGEDVNLVTELADDLPATLADPTQLEQVVMNLVLNARDAMPRGGALTITTAPDAEADRVAFEVRDEGQGIDAETLERIFEPFFTTKQAGRGTGLGLATAYGIVRQSGGDIEVESAPGEGATFRVLLPAATESAEPARSVPGRAVLAPGHETVLVVEDEDGVRTVVRTILETAGYKVLVSGDGEEARRVARDQTDPIDLLVTDLVMPGASGVEVAHTLAAEHPGLRTLYISGYSDVMPEGMQRGDDKAFLGKPFTPAELCARVREVLNEPRCQSISPIRSRESEE